VKFGDNPKQIGQDRGHFWKIAAFSIDRCRPDNANGLIVTSMKQI